MKGTCRLLIGADDVSLLVENVNSDIWEWSKHQICIHEESMQFGECWLSCTSSESCLHTCYQKTRWLNVQNYNFKYCSVGVWNSLSHWGKNTLGVLENMMLGRPFGPTGWSGGRLEKMHNEGLYNMQPSPEIGRSNQGECIIGFIYWGVFIS
jgi:hypothetical protein